MKGFDKSKMEHGRGVAKAMQQKKSKHVPMDLAPGSGGGSAKKSGARGFKKRGFV